MYKILITGASGFIGSNLLQHYIENKYNVLNIDFKTPQNDEHKKYWRKINIIEKEAVEQEITEFKPDYIIHLAARTDLEGKHISDYSSNIIGTGNIIKVCNLLSNLKRVIFTSSMLVCQPGYVPSHSTDYAPSTIYGESKVEMEKIIRKENPEYEWAIVRPTSIWGPGFGIPYRNFFDMIINNRYFHIGKKSCTKTYGFIGNIVYQIDSILKAPVDKINKQVFYLGDYQATNIKEWANEIAKEIDTEIKTIPYQVIKAAALAGNVLKFLGITFPMTSFRLKNMTTDNVVDLSNTKEIAPNLPFSRIEGIQKTLEWISNNK